MPSFFKEIIAAEVAITSGKGSSIHAFDIRQQRSLSNKSTAFYQLFHVERINCLRREKGHKIHINVDCTNPDNYAAAINIVADIFGKHRVHRWKMVAPQHLAVFNQGVQRGKEITVCLFENPHLKFNDWNSIFVELVNQLDEAVSPGPIPDNPQSPDKPVNICPYLSWRTIGDVVMDKVTPDNFKLPQCKSVRPKQPKASYVGAMFRERRRTQSAPAVICRQADLNLVAASPRPGGKKG